MKSLFTNSMRDLSKLTDLAVLALLMPIQQKQDLL